MSRLINQHSLGTEVILTGYSIDWNHQALSLSFDLTFLYIIGSFGHSECNKLFVTFPWVVTTTGPRGFMICVYYMTGAPEGSLKVVYGGAGNRTCDPWFTRHRFIPYTTAAFTLSAIRLTAHHVLHEEVKITLYYKVFTLLYFSNKRASVLA